MKDQPRGPFERATAVAEGFAAAVRRRQRDREPRVLLYHRPGDPHVLPPGAKGHDAILDLAERMVALADEAEPEAAPARWGRPRREEDPADEGAAAQARPPRRGRRREGGQEPAGRHRRRAAAAEDEPAGEDGA